MVQPDEAATRKEKQDKESKKRTCNKNTHVLFRRR
jgi:hypothetical protein